MTTIANWLNENRYQLISEKSSKNLIYKIRDMSNGSKRLLKVMSVRELDENEVNKVVDSMNVVKKFNLNGLMKYKVIECDGKNLYRVMKEYKINLNNIDPLKFFEDTGPFEVLNGTLLILNSLHENGMIHSDLKPSNIFLNEENEIIISDYLNNLLYKGREGNPAIRRINDLCFICIDELLGKDLDISSDIWNFGLIFYYIVSGKYPFVGSSVLETMKNIENINYTPLDCEGRLELNNFLHKVLCISKKNRLKLNEIMTELKKLNEPLLPVIPGDNDKEEEDDKDVYEDVDQKLSINNQNIL